MHSSPSHDYFTAITALIPLLLITAFVEQRAGSKADNGESAPDDEQERPADVALDDLVAILFAVIGEVAALAALTTARASRLEAEAATLGTALMAVAVLAPVLFRYVQQPKRWRKALAIAVALLIMLIPLGFGFAYVGMLYL